MAYDYSTSFQIPEQYYSSIFNALPGNSFLLQTDAPKFTVLAATPSILKLSGVHREDLVGKGLFEVFPSNPQDLQDTGASSLRSSLEQVLRTGEPRQLPVQRYDVADEKGDFIERYWEVENTPVLSASGEVAYILHTTEDITHRIKAEAREVQIAGIEKAFDLFMLAPMVVALVKGNDHIIEMANQEAFKVWGTGPEMIGKPILQVLPELEGQGIIELFDQVRITGQPYYAYEVPVISTSNGQKEAHYFNIVYQPYYSEGKLKPSGVFTISHDVTDIVVAKRKVEESENKFRILAENTPVLITVGDETGKITYFNKAWTNLTGIPLDELLKLQWLDLIHAGDKDQLSTIFSKALESKSSFTDEFRVKNADGVYHWLLAHAVPRYTADGTFVGYISACTDITEHKKVQQQLLTALEQIRLSKEAAELGTFDMDLESGTMHWDDRCRTLFGISHNETVTYEKDFMEGLHPDDRERIVKIIDQLFDRSISNGDYDVEYRTIGAQDGVIRWVRAKGKVYFNAAGKPLRFIGSVLDITEKVLSIQEIESQVEERTRQLAHANETLLQTNEELQRSNANLEEFTYAASHDLKEPIRKISIFTDQLQSQLGDRLTENENRLFSRISYSTHRMENLVDDLLQYSVVSHRPPDTEAIDLNQKLQRVLEDLELHIEEKGATINIAKLPVVNGFRRQLQQLFHNLITNALKYSKADEAPVIGISSTEVVHSGKRYYMITVTDNGIGFEEQYADRIFQMFARLHGKNDYSGTGVGLSIVKKVVENHNGFISVKSIPGVGSTFMVYLPIE